MIILIPLFFASSKLLFANLLNKYNPLKFLSIAVKTDKAASNSFSDIFILIGIMHSDQLYYLYNKHYK